MKKILFPAILAAVFAIIGTALIHNYSVSVGTALPTGVAIFETSLSAPITDTATTMTLTANSIRGGGSLSGYECFTIDEGSAQAEFVCGTVSGTTVSNLERGLSPADGITETAALQFSHRRGSSVKITDFPLIQRLTLQANGDGSYENLLSYAAGVTPSGSNHLTDVEYVLSVVNGGSVSFDRMVLTGNAGASIATGTVVYKSLSDGEWYAADADDEGTYVERLLGITQGAGTDGSAITGGVLVRGFDETQSGLSANTRYYLSTTAGAISTASSSQFLGISNAADEFFFFPTKLEQYYGHNIEFAGDVTFSGGASGIIDFQAYTTPGTTTWTKLPGASYIEVIAVGGGGGGGGGYGNGTGEGSGSGGAGGGVMKMKLLASQASATETITVGDGGTGGTGGNGGTAATAGADGGDSSFGTLVVADGGTGGGQGSNGGASGISSANYSVLYGYTFPTFGLLASSGGNGAPGVTTGLGITASSTQQIVPTGGGSGQAAASPSIAGSGGSIQGFLTIPGGTTGANGTSTPARIFPKVGTGGGGGAGNTTAVGSDGGDGADYGGGGGGGGASQSNTGGAGGDGGQGVIYVVTYR